ncbi:MAG: peptidase M23 [Micavibrio sp.]|nr:peptidase M23 [Micavibrio sp.]|tara:strand:- start:562 stop:1758 length:1197 start_codon:yes stop_codon:yes gene_type:complete
MTRFLIFFGLLLVPVCVQAESPMPRTHPTKNIEQKVKETKQKSVALKKQVKTLESDLGKTRKAMVSLAAKMKANEKKILDLEARIDERKKEQMAIEVRLETDKGTISDLILGMDRINRVPPEALLARPGSPLKTAQSAMLLESILPSIYERAGQLKKDRENLNAIIADLQAKEDKIITASKDLSTQEKRLKSLMNKRESLLAKTQSDYKKKTAEIKIISAQAKTLKDLMKKIERKQEQANKMAAAAARPGNTAKPASFTQKTPLPKAGKPQLPVSGTILTSYGRVDDIGAKSEGLTIKTRRNSIIVAPMGGIVEYTGTFRSYGNIVLIKHKGKYMSLIAGLGQINVAVGQSVSVGEPIGKTSADSLKNNGDGRNTTLYYELRYKGNPINPSKKFTGIR